MDDYQKASKFAPEELTNEGITTAELTQFQRKSPEFYQNYKAASMVIFKHSPKTAAVAEEV